jgi:hypothetical protein
MKELHSYTGQHFIFHLIKEHNLTTISLSSDYVNAPVDKFELKELADFIYNALQMDIAKQVMIEDSEALKNLSK